MSILEQHNGNGIRYAMHLSAPKGGAAQMLCDPAGGWVGYEDYARLKTDSESKDKIIESFAANLIRIGNECRDWAAECRMLSDKNKLLTKAGDELAEQLHKRGASYEIGFAIQQWQIAKGTEGQQADQS
jgi:hypothetical protein